MSVSQLDRPTTPAPPPPPPRPPASGWFRAFALRLHFYAGVLVGPFVLVAALSGTLYAATHLLEPVMYDRQLHVEPSARDLPLADQVLAAQRAADGPTRLDAVWPARSADGTTRVIFTDDRLGTEVRRAIFVDPGTGEIRGDEAVYASTGDLPARTWAADLHSDLHLGAVGRLYSELAASWLWVIALGGLVLWADRVRRRRRRRAKDAGGGRSARQRLVGRHSTTGVVLLIGLLVLSVTGLTWSTYAGSNITALRLAMDWDAPAVDTTLAGGTARSLGQHAEDVAAGRSDQGRHVDPATAASFDRVLRTARAAGIDAAELEIKRPEIRGEAWTVSEIRWSWPLQADTVAIDPTPANAGTQTTSGSAASLGTVVDQVDFADFPFMAKLARWGIALHMGMLFGVANQVVLFLFGATIVALLCWGYLLWWRRRPTRNGSTARLARPPARGAARRAPIGALLLGALAVVVLAWAIPFLGWSLIGFLLVDAVVARRQRRTPVGGGGLQGPQV